MPAVAVKAAFEKHPEIFARIPLRDGEDEKAVDLRKIVPHHLIKVTQRDQAHVVRYMYNGCERIFRLGDRVHVANDELLFCMEKYPELHEVISLEEVADSETAVLLAGKVVAVENEKKRLQADLDTASNNMASLQLQVQGADRRATALSGELELERQAKAKLAAELEELKKKLAKK
jgi:chromosome segregation ATPase